MTLISFNAKHLTTTKSINTQAHLEIGPSSRYQVKLEAIDNSEGNKRDYKTSILIESGIFPPVKISAIHKDDSVHFKTKLDAGWRNTESLVITSDISYTREEYDFVSNGNVELLSTLYQAKQIKADWLIENRDSHFANNLKILHNFNNIFNSALKGFYEWEPSMFKLDCSGEATLMQEPSVKIANILDIKNPSNINNRFTLSRDTVSVYSHNFVLQEESVSLKVLIPNVKYKTIEVSRTIKGDQTKGKAVTFFKIGESNLFHSEEDWSFIRIPDNKMEIRFKAKITSDHMQVGNAQIKWKLVVHQRYYSIESEITANSRTIIKMAAQMDLSNQNVKCKVSLKSKYELLKRFNFNFEHLLNQEDGTRTDNLGFSLNDDLKFHGNLSFRKYRYINVDFGLKQRTWEKFLKLQYNHHLMGYEHFFETNIFKRKVKFVSSAQSRGGFVVQAKLENFWLFKTLEVLGKFSKDTLITFIYQQPDHFRSKEKIKLFYSSSKGVQELSVESSSYFNGKIKLDLVEFKTISLEFQAKSTEPKLEFKFNYEGGKYAVKHSSQIMFVSGKNKMEFRNKLEKVTRRYLLIETELNSSWKKLEKFKFKYEYRDRPNKSLLNLEGLLNEKFVKLSGDLDRQYLNNKIELKVETSFTALKEINFSLTQKQNERLTMLKHNCKTIVKSTGKEFKLENDVEWSNYNNARIESSFMGQTPEGEYFIEPKSLKFVHNSHQFTLKDSLEIQLGKDKILKLSTKLPFESVTKMEFEFESYFEQVKKLSVELDIDSSQPHESKYALTIERNNERDLFLKAYYKLRKGVFLLTSNLELFKTRQTNFELNWTDSPQDGKILKFKFLDALMKEPITLDAKLNLNTGQFSMLIKGRLKEKMSTKMELSRSTIFTKVVYGRHVVLVDMRKEKSQLFMVEITSVIRMKCEFLRSDKDTKLFGSFEDNSLAIGFNVKGEFNFDSKIMGKSLNFVLKSIDWKKWVLNGKSNLKNWSEFSSELEIQKTLEYYKLKIFFNREAKEILNAQCLQKFGRSFSIQYTSVYEYLKSGHLTFDYDKAPSEISLDVKADIYGIQFLKAEYKIGKESFNGKIRSSFEWIKEFEIKGTLKSGNDEFTGTFSLVHNKLQKSIDGEFKLQIKKYLVKLEMKTPLDYPYNEMTFRQERTNDFVIIELASKENKLFAFQWKNVDRFVYLINIDIFIPKSIKDFTFSLSSNIDFKGPKNMLKLVWKSNLFKESTLEIVVDNWNSRLKVRYSSSMKESLLDLGISRFKDFGIKIDLSVQHDDDKNSAEIWVDLGIIQNIYLETKVKVSSFVSSPLNFEAKYEHKADFPQTFYLNAQTKYNDKTVVHQSINMQRQPDNSVDLSGKFILSPFEKEYENKIELSYKQQEKLSLTISSPEILKEEIEIRVTKRSNTFDISWKSPFELLKSGEFIIRLERHYRSWTHAITFNTNKWGKYEIISEYKMSSNLESQLNSQINTPSTNRKIFGQINFKHDSREKMLKSELVFDEKVFNFEYVLKHNDFSLKLYTPFDILKRCELAITSKLSRHEADISYNQNKFNFVYIRRPGLISLTSQSNSNYFKTISASIKERALGDLGRSIAMELIKDDKNLNMGFRTTFGKPSLLCTVENNLLFFLPKQFSGKFQYDFNKYDTFVELKTNDVVFFKLIHNKEEFLFNIINKVFQAPITETKIQVTRNRIELIFLTNSKFSVLITRTSPSQIDGVAIINENQYSLRSKYEMTTDTLKFKLSTFRNAVDELLEITNEIDRYGRSIDVEVKLYSKRILKLKFSNSNFPQKISVEAKIFSFNGVADWTMKRKPGMVDAKVSWNVLYNDQQLLLGSIELGAKYDRPLKYLLNINLQQMAFQAQIMESDNGEFTFTLIGPYKTFDTTLKWQYLSKPNEYEISCSLKSSFATFSANTAIHLNKDPELRFIFSSTSPIIRFNLKMITSIPKELTVKTEFQFLDWEKFVFNGKISTKDLIELSAVLQTPFSSIKRVEVKKTINYISFFEHKYETTIIYNGYRKLQYTGAHEIYWSKNSFKLQNSFHREDVKIISLFIDHSGNHNKLDHSFIWHIRERKFGFKLNGGFNPLFEGHSEIYTPFHEMGKIVVMGKQMKSGILLEARKSDGEFGSFEYLSEKDTQSMRITPPSKFGKPLYFKHRARRSRRSASDNNEIQIMYGMDNLVKLSTKITMTENKYAGYLNIAAPTLTQKAAELSLDHYYNDGAWNFDHHLKIKDSVHKTYRISGKVFRENAKNFKMSLSADHPDFEPMHLSLGHLLTTKSYEHHFTMKSGDQTILHYNNNVKFDVIKSSFIGEWITKVYSHNYQLNVLHNGEWDEFKQSVVILYNDSPFWQYKGHVVPKQRSVIEMKIPRFHFGKIVVTFDRVKNQAEISWAAKSVNHVVDISNQNGQLLVSYKRDNENVAALLMRYNKQPFYAKASYLQHSGSVEMDFKDSVLSLKAESTFMRMKKALVEISKNKIISEVDYYGKLYTASGQYEYMPGKFNCILKSSIKEISVISFKAVPNQWTLRVNDYHKTIQYIIKPNHVRLQGENNFFKMRTFLFDLKFQPNEKAVVEMELNSFMSKTKLENNKDGFLFHNENNYFSMKSLELKIVRKIQPNLNYYGVILSVNQNEKLQMQWEKKDQQYVFGWKTFLGHHVVISFDQKSNKMIASLKNKNDHLNINLQLTKHLVQSSKTYTIETNVDSSFEKLQKLTNELSYTVTDDEYDIQSKSTYNGRSLQLKGKLSKSQVSFDMKIDEMVNGFTATLHSTNNLVLEIVIQNHKMNINIKKERSQYLLDIRRSNRDYLIVRVNHDLYHKYGFDHKSIIEYYGLPIWDFSFKSDFKKHEMIMKRPIKLDASVTIDWKEKEETTLAFLLKFSEKSVMGAGIKYLFTSQSTSYEVYIENYLHIISVRKETKLSTNKDTSLKLINKNTKDQWELKVKSVKEKSLELLWKTPNNIREIKYKQIVENHVRTLMELEAPGFLQFHLSLAKPDLWKGYLTIYSKRIVSIEAGKDYANAFINEGAPEDQRIILKYVISSEGEWKKNYKSIKQLVVVQKGLNINFDVFIETRMESTFYSTLTKVKYQMIDGKMKNLKLGASIDFTKDNQLKIEVENPVVPIKTVLYRFQPDKTTLRYEMRTVAWEKDKIDGYFELKTGSNPGMMGKLHYNSADPTEFFQFHAKYINDRQMETHVFSEKNEIKTTYFLFHLALMNEHSMKMTFSMKTRLLFKLTRHISVKPQLIHRFVTYIDRETQWIDKEMTSRGKQISNIIPVLKDLHDQAIISFNEFERQIFNLITNDEFYSRTIFRISGNLGIFTAIVIDASITKLIYITDNIPIIIFRLVGSFADFFQGLSCQIRGYLNELFSLRDFQIFLHRTYLPNILRYLSYIMEDFIVLSKRVLTDAITLTRSTKRLINTFFLSNTYKLLENSIEIIKNTIGKLMDGSLDFLKYEEEIRILYQTSIDKLEKMLTKLRGKMMSVLLQVDDHLSLVMGDNYFQNLGQILSMLSDELIQFLKNENNQKIARNVVSSSILQSLYEFTDSISKFTMKFVWPYYVVVDQESISRKEVKMTLRLTFPIPINDFKSLPDLNFLRKKIVRTKFFVNHLKQMGKKFSLSMSRIPEIAKWFYFTIPPMTYPSILPEFESYATVSKSSIVTFDKRILELNTDKCRILLSKDLQNKKWEIILNQENKQRFYTVNIGKNSIRISGSDYKVTLNGIPTELPLEIGSTTLVGLGRVMKLKDDDLGLAITVDPLNEIFTVGISGWYHGRVRGLFGNSDNEPFNDLMLNNGNIVSKDVFAKIYNDNGQTCNFKMQLKPDFKPVQGCPFLKKVVCKFLYKCPWSPLAACFKKVDPTNFLQMCVNSNEELQLKYDPSVCDVARQYQSQCLQAGVKIPVPVPCQRCDMKNEKPLALNESRTMKVTKKASDIVLIVDEGHCFNALQPKLPSLVSDLEKEMNSKGIIPVRFGLVTYVGNEKNSASFHTVGQKMLGTGQEMIRSLKALSSSKGSYKDVIGGIEQAYEYPFSDHSSKHIIMVSCQSINELPASFQTIANKLQQKGIHFSLLTDFSFKLKDNKAATIFGVDSKYIYTDSSADVDRGSTIRPVNDFLYKLAMQIKGIAYDYKFLISNQKLTERKFTNSLVTQISLRATPARSTKCTCIEDGEYNCVPLDVYQIFPVKSTN